MNVALYAAKDLKCISGQDMMDKGIVSIEAPSSPFKQMICRLLTHKWISSPLTNSVDWPVLLHGAKGKVY